MASSDWTYGSAAFADAAIGRMSEGCTSYKTRFAGLMDRAATMRLVLFDACTVQANRHERDSISSMQRSKRKYTDCLLNLH